MKSLIVLILAISLMSCQKDTITPKEQKKEIIVKDSLSLMIQFLDSNVVKHTTWWEIDKVYLDTGRVYSITHNTVAFPSFAQFPGYNVQGAVRTFNFYQESDDKCPVDTVAHFTAEVIIYAGNKVFHWYKANIQWEQIYTDRAAYGSPFGKDPRRIEMYMVPKNKRSTK